MTESDIIRLAKQAGAQPTNDTCDAQYVITAEGLAHFAALIRQDEAQACARYYLQIMRDAVKQENEACAKVAEWTPDAMGTAQKIAAAIRERAKP